MSFQYSFADITPEYLNTLFTTWISQTNSAVDEVIAVNNEDRNFDNTFRKVYLTDLICPSSYFNLMESVHPDSTIRDIANDLLVQSEQFSVKLSFRYDLFEAYKAYIDTKYETDKKSLDKEHNRYIEHTMRNYKKKGFELPKETRDKVEQIQLELKEIESKFSKNINDFNDFLVFTKEEMKGMPESWFVGKEPILKNGRNYFKITTAYPDFVPFMECVDDSLKRKQVLQLYDSKGGMDNLNLLNKALLLRKEMSTLLGYDTYADYATDDKMIKNGKNAMEFLEEFRKKIKTPYRHEYRELLAYAQVHKTNPLNKTNFDVWDISYYKKKMRQDIHDYDDEEVKEYFGVDTVVKGTLNIYQKVLKLKFEEIDVPSWHTEVKFYKVIDNVTNETNGYFFIDLHPREGKYSHAAAFPVCYPYDKSEIGEVGRSETLAGIVCNFPKLEPMRIDDVETFFHEFGHVMHFVNAKTKLSDFNSFGVEGDFVEFPSQMFELWVYEKEPSEILSKHITTGEPIPENLLQKIKNARKFMQASHYARQLVYGLFDLRVHHNYVYNDAIDVFRKTYNELLELELPHDMLSISHFGHIMGGYQAGYYGYLYSEVMSTSAYMLKFKGKELDENVGYEYRQKVFEKGSSLDGRELFDSFVGQKEDPIYLLELNGLA